MNETSSKKQLRSSQAMQQFQKEWFKDIQARIKGGEPYGICNADEVEEVFTFFGMPVIVVQWWAAVIAAKRMSEHYSKVLAERGYDMDHYNSIGLGCTLDNNPETAPWGGLPKPAVIIGSVENDHSIKSKELWAQEFGCPLFPMEKGETTTLSRPNWWENIRDHWDEIIEPHLLDFRVQQLRELIKFLEVMTGKQLSLARIRGVLELSNEQNDYWREARDLIAKTVPCPVSLPDQLSMYPAQWHRGTTHGRDLIKGFYEEVEERVQNGEAACPNERIRLMWIGPGLWSNTAFYQYFEEKYGATFVCSMYTGIAGDGYPRKIKDDPLRALASRHLFIGLGDPAWLVKEAKLHQCQGAVRFPGGSANPAPIEPAFKKAGIPLLEIPGHNVDSRKWDDAKVKSLVSEFIETAAA
ncbi:MAG: 2-hydroxyacyl-CoA dehydratase [Deltaproteobacteria bacterium]|nr:2-hydroxyacyl-CoA dehydratase [Deltaproteobacteria bacterium]